MQLQERCWRAYVDLRRPDVQDRMKFIVGLGNPGKKYEWTRHNVGFLVVDALAKESDGPFKKGLQSRHARQRLEGESVILVKPETYMNLSGRAVQAVLHYFKGTPEDLLVVHDDLDLQPGRLRFRARGSSGGHNGIASIIECLGTREFHRLKFGIRRDDRQDSSDFVLGRLGTSSSGKGLEEKIKNDIDRAASAVKSWVRDGFEVSAAIVAELLGEKQAASGSQEGTERAESTSPNDR